MSVKDPVEKQFINLSLIGGVNKKRDAHLLQNGELLTADNVVFTAVDGQVTKRYGFQAVTPQGALFQGGPFKSLGCRDNIEPLVLGANTLNRYNVAQNLSTAISTPTQGRLTVSQIAGSSGKTQYPWPPSDPSCATDGTQYVCVTWQEPNAIGSFCYYGVQDLASGSWIIPPVQISNLYSAMGGYSYYSMMSPKVTYSNGNFYIFYLWCGTIPSGSNTNYTSMMVCATLPLNNLSGGLQSNSWAYAVANSVGANLSTSPQFMSYDVHMANGKFFAAIGPQQTDGQTIQYYWGTTSASGVLTTANGLQFTSNMLLSGQRIAVKCDGPAATPYLIATANGLTTFTAAGTPTTYKMSTLGSPQPFPLDCMWLPNGFPVWLGYNGSGSSLQVVATQVSLPSGTLTKVYGVPPLDTYYQQILSRAFTITETSKLYTWIGSSAPSSDSVYNSAYLIEFDFSTQKSMTVCRTLYLSNAHITGNDMTVPCEVLRVPNTSKYVTFVSSALEKTASDYHSFGALNRLQFDFAPSRPTQLIPLPTGGVLGAGAYPFYYDGSTVVEAGFSSTPTGDAMTSSYATLQGGTPSVLSAASGLAGGTSFVTASGYVEYYYVICLVRRDAYGNVYRSAPSPVITVPCPNAINQVIFPSYTYNGGGNVMIEYYRSTQNITASHYFIGQVPNGTAYIDTKPDGSTTPSNNTSITKNRLVYTDSGELPNDPPPAVHHIAVSESRAYLIPSDNRNVVWYSKQFSPGRTVEWCANLTMSEGLNSGQFTALAILDGYLIIFKADQILYTYGNGPDNTGANGSFQPFARISSDVGCIDPGSIAVIPDGVVFKSRRGIELLTRSLQVSYIGSDVEPIVQTMGTIASVVVMPGFSELRFVPSTAGQPVLCYDYNGKRWSTFSNMAAVQALSVQGNYWFISADGALVNQETPGAYLDNGSPIQMTLETAEIPVGSAGAQGWGRAYRMALLGDFYNDCTLTVQFAYDHANTYTDAVQFSTAVGLINGDTVFQFRASRLPRQVMQTLRLKIQDSGTAGQRCAISNVALEVGSKNGLAKLSAQKTV